MVTGKKSVGEHGIASAPENFYSVVNQGIKVCGEVYGEHEMTLKI